MEYSILMLVPLIFGFMSGDAWQTTFCDIALVSSLDIIHCDQVQDTLTFEAGDNINIELFNTTDTIKISASGGNSPNEKYCDNFLQNYNSTTNNFDCGDGISIFELENVTSSPCNEFEVLKMNSTGFFECVVLVGSGEVNTASNVGIGLGIFDNKDGVNLEFNSLIGGQGITITDTIQDLTIDLDIKINSVNNSCSGTDKVTDVNYNNSTGILSIVCDTDSSGGTPRSGYLVAHWTQSQTKSNIGTSFVNVYTQTNSNGKAILIDTDTFTEVRLQIQWNKIGGGTQDCQVINGANVLVSLTVVSGSNDSGFDSIPVGLLNAENEFRLQCKSTTSTDDPIFESASIWLR